MSHAVKFEISVSTNSLDNYTDQYLSFLMQLSQAAGDSGSERQARFADRVRDEIIRRWMSQVPPDIHGVSMGNHYWRTLADNGQWVDQQWRHKSELDGLNT